MVRFSDKKPHLPRLESSYFLPSSSSTFKILCLGGVYPTLRFLLNFSKNFQKNCYDNSHPTNFTVLRLGQRRAFVAQCIQYSTSVSADGTVTGHIFSLSLPLYGFNWPSLVFSLLFRELRGKGHDDVMWLSAGSPTMLQGNCFDCLSVVCKDHPGSSLEQLASI